MAIKERQDIQEVNIRAEQLNFLLQTMHAHHKDFDCFQMNALWEWLMTLLEAFTPGQKKRKR